MQTTSFFLYPYMEEALIPFMQAWSHLILIAVQRPDCLISSHCGEQFHMNSGVYKCSFPNTAFLFFLRESNCANLCHLDPLVLDLFRACMVPFGDFIDAYLVHTSPSSLCHNFKYPYYCFPSAFWKLWLYHSDQAKLCCNNMWP